MDDSEFCHHQDCYELFHAGQLLFRYVFQPDVQTLSLRYRVGIVDGDLSESTLNLLTPSFLTED